MTFPSVMTAIAIENGSGPATALHPTKVPTPIPRDGEVLIRVAAAGVNRPDLFQRMGYYPAPPGASTILGLEIAGEVVVAAGRWQVGDKVCGLLAGGGYAEYAACDARHLLAVPANVNMVEAAGLPETIFTVYANVFEGGCLVAGDTLLVHGATSGIGVAAIQMAKAAGARVIATARGANKADAAKQFGADVSIDASSGSFSVAVIDAGGADVVLDMVGASYLAENLAALNHRGRLVFIAALSGSEASLPIITIMQKQISISGSALRARSTEEKARLTTEIERVVLPWIESGAVRSVVDTTFPLANAAQAHALLESGTHFGKVILTL